MKKLALIALVVFSAQLSHAYPWCDPTPHDPQWHPGDDESTVHGPRCKPNVIASCAPEVVEGNVAATERTLTTIVAQPEFANATAFKATVAKIAGEKNASVKVAKYFALIGVDASKSADVVEFVGARDIKAQWLSSLEKSGNLSSSQADTVARQLQTALRGSLQ